MSTTETAATDRVIGVESQPGNGRVQASPPGGRLGDGADDPITGPMPAIDLLEGQVRAHVHKGVTIVALDGGLDEALAARVGPVLPGATTGAAAVILDLDQVTLLERAAFEHLATALDRAAGERDRCVVASRLSGRMVLERWQFADRYAIFTSVPDALQARAFALSGYGEGWVPAA